MKRQVNCGDVLIGGDAPVSVQSMANTNTADVKSTVEQIARMKDEGCEIARVAVPDMQAAAAVADIKRMAGIPIVADIHFDYRLAMAAIDAGADKIRINPGNIGGEERVRQVAAKAAEHGIPIRVGVNSGSLERDILEKYGGVTAPGLAESALRNVKILEEYDFRDVVVSLKSSNLQMNYDAYRIVDESCDYPLHIGVTEAGTPHMGKIKSAAGIGALLLNGIGNTLRVSLTADPVEEVIFARELLASLGLRKEGIEIISCPTCGRTLLDMERIVAAVEKRINGADLRTQGLKVAVMGCAVNGPGEARDADIGVACGKDKGVIFKDGRIIKTVCENDIPDEIVRLAQEYERNH